MSDTMIPDQPTRVASLGAGYFSQFHRDSWGRLPDAQLVSICDPDLAKAQAAAEDAQALAFADADEMLSKVQPDLLDIAAPPNAHAAEIRRALAAGVQWIICQKPFCASRDEARDIVAEAEAHGARLIVHENFRFQPWFRTIKSLIDAGRIGSPVQACFRLRPGDGQGADAYLARQPYFQTMPRFLIHETGGHFLDVFSYLFGAPVSLYADLRRVNPVIAGEDAGLVILEHEGGVRTVLDGNRTLDHAARDKRRTMGEALIEGTMGSLTLLGDGSVHLRGFDVLDTTCASPPVESPNFGGDCVHAFQTHALAALRSGAPAETEARAYLNVMALIDACYDSTAKGARVSLPSSNGAID